MPWSRDWLAAAAPQRRDLWRGVEAQHRVATMKLADSLHDQELLEQLLEASKPKPPPEAAGMDYLLFTPFRYTSPWPSRFRRPGEPGAWYGADDAATVAAEIAYWRWRFFMDSDGLREEQVLTEHTFFQARFEGLELDLTAAPWAAERATWRDPQNYAACQELARAARAVAPPVQAIRYESARREGGWCEVVFDPRSLRRPRQHLQQTWTCKTTKQRVLLSHDTDRLQFDMA
ncbi:RES family NAD+ phosphorylase [Ramlibacter alkalitolerans]|uniref:RES family NAD+ phosphorylase n=1 Tax=Ramlibacter alkalitolerans TaxID=2039631 RepID=A0ABS1JIV7_9BURK|nr:RES family NAD+ phosphorylase [Ramlibacter alkalitolerans]MBL0424144.1 RES family NAD+ phosphorylase [Ramlibacter alkalitolerans]